MMKKLLITGKESEELLKFKQLINGNDHRDYLSEKRRNIARIDAKNDRVLRREGIIK